MLQDIFFDDIDLTDHNPFFTSIRENGILEPLVVTSDYIVISGHQRLRAALQENFKSVPIVIREDFITENETLMALLVSNFGREENNPIKKARILKAYETLRNVRKGSAGKVGKKNLDGNTLHATRDEVAKEFGMTGKQYGNYLKLLELILELQTVIAEGRISARPE